jgi:hypothetical protein
MTQPSFVPITEADQIRPSLQLETPGHWVAQRPADLRGPSRRAKRGFGTPGPDQGYALSLAKRFEGDLRLAPGEVVDDVLVGSAMVASTRSARFGRAPSIYDLQAALAIFGFRAEAPEAFLATRKVLFRSASHDYFVQRSIVDLIDKEVLARRPEEIDEWFRAGGWRQLCPDVNGTSTG